MSLVGSYWLLLEKGGDVVNPSMPLVKKKMLYGLAYFIDCKSH